MTHFLLSIECTDGQHTVTVSPVLSEAKQPNTEVLQRVVSDQFTTTHEIEGRYKSLLKDVAKPQPQEEPKPKAPGEVLDSGSLIKRMLSFAGKKKVKAFKERL